MRPPIDLLPGTGPSLDVPEDGQPLGGGTPKTTRPSDEDALPPRASLVLVHGYGEGQFWRLPPGRAVIGRGRSHGHAIQLLDTDVSRTHAYLDVTDVEVRLRDAGSTNGTFVNDRPAVDEVLHHNDRIRVAGTILHFIQSDRIEIEVQRLRHHLCRCDGLTGLLREEVFLECLDHELLAALEERRGLALARVTVGRLDNPMVRDAARTRVAHVVVDALPKPNLRTRGNEDFVTRKGDDIIACVASTRDAEILIADVLTALRGHLGTRELGRLDSGRVALHPGCTSAREFLRRVRACGERGSIGPPPPKHRRPEARLVELFVHYYTEAALRRFARDLGDTADHDMSAALPGGIASREQLADGLVDILLRHNLLAEALARFRDDHPGAHGEIDAIAAACSRRTGPHPEVE